MPSREVIVGVFDFFVPRHELRLHCHEVVAKHKEVTHANDHLPLTIHCNQLQHSALQDHAP